MMVNAMLYILLIHITMIRIMLRRLV